MPRGDAASPRRRPELRRFQATADGILAPASDVPVVDAAELKARLLAAVDAERAEEQKLEDLIKGRGTDALEKEGRLIRGLAAKFETRLLNELVWKFSTPRRDAEKPLPYHRLRQGERVVICEQSPASLAPAAEAGADVQRHAAGTIEHVGRMHLSIALSIEGHDWLQARPPGTAYRVSWGPDESTYDRQVAAIEVLCSRDWKGTSGQDRVRRILLTTADARGQAEHPPIWTTSRNWTPMVTDLVQKLEHANPSQKDAVMAALHRTYTLWQGPPGTGKTSTLVSLLDVLCQAGRRHSSFREKVRILAVASTNAAVDNLLEGLLERGIKAVRVGAPARIRPDLRYASVEAQAEQTEQGKQAAELRAKSTRWFDWVKNTRQQLDAAKRELQQVRSSATRAEVWEFEQKLKLGEGNVHNAKDQADAIWKEADVLIAGSAVHVLERAEVVVATLAGSADQVLRNSKFKVVVIDEASQATEPTTFIPLVKGAEMVVMAGDPNQLPPTILSQAAINRYGLDICLYDKLLDGGLESLLLEVQYRMHPKIAEFPSKQFYDGQIVSGITISDRALVKGIPWPRPDCPVLFIDVEGSEMRTSSSMYDNGRGGKSFYNMQEAEAIISTLGRVLEDKSVLSCAVLTPYNGQLRVLRSLARARFPEALQTIDVEFSTVDGFQGREAEVVLFSAVRCNPPGRLGFVADPRRLNVAITRAKRGLIVAGCQATLSADANWRAWLEWYASHDKRLIQ